MKQSLADLPHVRTASLPLLLRECLTLFPFDHISIRLQITIMGESWRLFSIELFRVTSCLVRKYVLTYSVVAQHDYQAKVMSAAKSLHTPLTGERLWLLYWLERSGSILR
jgi:hypothetical protein